MRKCRIVIRSERSQEGKCAERTFSSAGPLKNELRPIRLFHVFCSHAVRDSAKSDRKPLNEMQNTIQKLLCRKERSLIEAMRVINSNAKGAVFVVDDESRLCGVLTDGDIRRYLLMGHEVQERVEHALPKESVYAFCDQSKREILAKLTRKVRIVPIVRRDLTVIDYVELHQDVHVPIVSPDLSGNELAYLTDAFLSNWISSGGEYVKRFENEFARVCTTRYAAATSNGTSALHLAFLACRIMPGDEVILPNLTFAATVNAVLYIGAKPVLVDVDPRSWCISVPEIQKAITPRTKAIVPVHLFGQPCEMDSIVAIARERKLLVIEDCAQAHGAEFDSRRVGSFGDIGCFSFFANKIITTGEGGMCTTNSKQLHERICLLRDHGMSRSKKYWHTVVGYNYRMTNLQASVGVAQLERIDDILERRRSVEARYREALSGLDCVAFPEPAGDKYRSVSWLVRALIKTKNLQDYFDEFKRNDIDVRRVFYPLFRMPLYKKYSFSGRISARISNAGICFPSGTSIDDETISDVVRIIRRVRNREKRTERNDAPR